MTRLTIPMPPSVNLIYRPVRGRGMIKTERYRKWITAAGWEIKAQKAEKVEGDYALWAYCQKADKRKRDLGNIEKALSDILVTHGIVGDDSQCVEMHLYWDGAGRDCTVIVEPAKPMALARAA